MAQIGSDHEPTSPWSGKKPFAIRLRMTDKRLSNQHLIKSILDHPERAASFV
jgi:hypothetical protein